MIAEVNEQTTDDVWILYDTGSAVTVCPHGFEEALGTRNDTGGPRCDAATRSAVTLGGRQGGARGDRGYKLQLSVQSGERHQTYRVGCRTLPSKMYNCEIQD